jgi:hypothetical protein
VIVPVPIAVQLFSQTLGWSAATGEHETKTKKKVIEHDKANP